VRQSRQTAPGSVRSTTLASFPASRAPAPDRGQRTRHSSAPSVPVVPSAARRTSTSCSCRVRTTRSSSGRPVGPTRAVTVRPATSSSAPTWSRSKCVSTSRSMADTPSSSRQDRSSSGSSPVSTSAVDDPSRRSTASPCPTSQAATLQSAGTDPRTTTVGTATAATPTTTPTAATSRSRSRTAGRTSTAAADDPLTIAAPVTPTTPAGHGALAHGSAVAPCATPPIALAGTQAIAASTSAPQGHTGATRQAPSPTTVTIGARGSVSRFAGTA